jgi:hypothetical protein
MQCMDSRLSGGPAIRNDEFRAAGSPRTRE